MDPPPKVNNHLFQLQLKDIILEPGKAGIFFSLIERQIAETTILHADQKV